MASRATAEDILEALREPAPSEAPSSLSVERGVTTPPTRLRPERATKADIRAALDADLDAPPAPPESEISEAKGFGGRLLERAGIPTTMEGLKNQLPRKLGGVAIGTGLGALTGGPLGAGIGALLGAGASTPIAESVDTALEALGIRDRPVTPSWTAPAGGVQLSGGDIAEQAALASPIGKAARYLSDRLRTSPPPRMQPPPGGRQGGVMWQETPPPAVAGELGAPPVPALPEAATPPPLALPPRGPRGGRPMPPPEPGAAPYPRFNELDAEIAARREQIRPSAPTPKRVPRTPVSDEIQGPVQGPSGDVELIDPTSGRFMRLPSASADERARLRQLYRRPISGETRGDIAGIGPDEPFGGGPPWNAPEEPRWFDPENLPPRLPTTRQWPPTSERDRLRAEGRTPIGAEPRTAPPPEPLPEWFDPSRLPPKRPALPDKPEWFDPSRLPPKREGKYEPPTEPKRLPPAPEPPPDWFDPSRLPPKIPKTPQSPSGRPLVPESRVGEVFGIDMEPPGAGKLPTPPVSLAPRAPIALGPGPTVPPPDLRIFRDPGNAFGDLSDFARATRAAQEAFLKSKGHTFETAAALPKAARDELHAEWGAQAPAPAGPTVPPPAVPGAGKPAPRVTPQVPGVRPDAPLPPPSAPPARVSDVQPPPPGAPSVGQAASQAAIVPSAPPVKSPLAQRVADQRNRVFVDGYLAGQRGEQRTARALHDEFPTMSTNDVEIYLSGQEDGLKGDLWRIKNMGAEQVLAERSPKSDLPAPGPTVPPPAPKPAPAVGQVAIEPSAPTVPPPQFERTAIGDQGLIGGTPERAMPSRALQAPAPQGEKSLDALEEAVARAQKRLEALGPEPHQPSPEGRAFGKLGRAGADPKHVARWDAEVKAHQAWTRRYSAAKKAEVAAQNALFEAKNQQGLLGPSKVEREVEAAGAQVGIEMRSRQQANVQEWLSDELGATPFKALVASRTPASIPAAVRKRLEDLGIQPSDAWHANQDTVPEGVLDRLAARSAAPPALPAPGPTVGPPSTKLAPFQRKSIKGEVPDLNDPDDLVAIIQRFGGVKPTEATAGELRDVQPFFKNLKNGTELSRISEALIADYPHLGNLYGDQKGLEDALVDKMRSYVTNRRDLMKKSTEWGPKDITVPKKDSKLKQAIDWFEQIGRDESGVLKLDSFAKTWKRVREKFPMEGAVREARPNSPVLAETERWNTFLSDAINSMAEQAWWRGARSRGVSVGRNQRYWLGTRAGGVRQTDPDLLKDAEEAAVAEWRANGGGRQASVAARHHFPQSTQDALAHRDQTLRLENAERRYFGMDEIAPWTGPYLPRRVEGESREAVRLGGGSLGTGRGVQSGVGPHGRARSYDTYREGERAGLEYEDPRNAILLREWEGIKLRATGRLFRNLEQKGGLFRSEAAARAASPTGRPWQVENAPGNGEWWTATEQEAKFLRDNLTESGDWSGGLVQYANAVLRNPNLVNPAPHVVKNMAYKLLLSGGPVSPVRLARDTVEYFRKTNPTLLREFHEAMPFSESGKIAGDVLGEQLHKGPIETAVKGVLRTSGKINRPSQKVIFEWADPAMRYSLYKHYREQGKGVYEAGNHAWEDLIRYGTRSSWTDFWKKMPGNFFVPWRFGTFASLVKQVRNHPVRTALLVGAVEYLREIRYRKSGKWTHLPPDYVQAPAVQLAGADSAQEFLTTLGAQAGLTWAFGPGGAFAASQIGSAANITQKLATGEGLSEGEKKRIGNMFWGISQIYNLPDEYKKGDYTGMLGTALLGEHEALKYEPKRFAKHLPEWLPGMRKAPDVREAEEKQERRTSAIERQLERRQQRRELRESLQ